MGHGPFAARKTDAQSAANRRRSTRIDHETSIILSGRDATGEIYRDETITEIVNIHGARVRTDRKVLVGMIVTIECIKTGRGSKGVCVNTYEPTPESPQAGIAVQILQPGNIWGLENPPSDWAMVAATLGGGSSPAESSWSGVGSSDANAPRVVRLPVAQPAKNARVGGAAETVIVEDSLAKLRAEADAVASSALEAFERRLAARTSEAEARLSQRVEVAAAELAAAVQTLKGSAETDLAARVSEAFQGFETVFSTFRSRFANELQSQHELAIQEVEHAMRERLAALVSTIMVPAQPTLAKPGPALKK